MTSDNVKTLFKKYITGDVITLPDKTIVDVSFFANLFSSVSNTPTYAELITADGGTRGYKQFFDKCKTDGVIS